jgi:ferredoxin
MIRSLVGRGMRRVQGKSSTRKNSTNGRSTNGSAPVASWSPPVAAKPTLVAQAASSNILDWVDDFSAKKETSSAEPAAPVASNGGSSFAAIAAAAASGSLGKAVHADAGSTDLAAYRARMRANGREIELAGEGMNVGQDGGQFWGPVDNESSRARATGLALTIDQNECISCGTCEENTDQVFLLPEAPAGQEEDKAEVLAQEGPMDLIQDAIDACPVTCIKWIPPTELAEAHSSGGFVSE